MYALSYWWDAHSQFWPNLNMINFTFSFCPWPSRVTRVVFLLVFLIWPSLSLDKPICIDLFAHLYLYLSSTELEASIVLDFQICSMPRARSIRWSLWRSELTTTESRAWAQKSLFTSSPRTSRRGWWGSLCLKVGTSLWRNSLVYWISHSDLGCLLPTYTSLFKAFLILSLCVFITLKTSTTGSVIPLRLVFSSSIMESKAFKGILKYQQSDPRSRHRRGEPGPDQRPHLDHDRRRLRDSGYPTVHGWLAGLVPAARLGGPDPESENGHVRETFKVIFHSRFATCDLRSTILRFSRFQRWFIF